MKRIARQLLGYWQETNKTVFLLSALFTAVLVFCNFYFGINQKINSYPFWVGFLLWFCLFLAAFGLPYFITALVKNSRFFQHRTFLGLLLVAPLIFSWKMSANLHFAVSTNAAVNDYWNAILYWPFKLVVVLGALFLIWKTTAEKQPFYGFSAKDFKAKPYFLMLLLMVPLLAAAATQPDFLAVYPKLAKLAPLPNEEGNWFYRLLFELSYGSDFLGIEVFFRGFLVLAFARFAGKGAILPMAVFYCTIHFGKPLAECISSFFGGIILGVVTYHSRSIWGGLIVHLGIAWLMELAGYLGRAGQF